MSAQPKRHATAEEIRRDTLYTQLLNGVPAAAFTLFGIWIVLDPARRTSPDWIFWYILIVALWHTVEEYIWPGGFVRWFNTVPFHSSDPNAPLSARRALITDGFAAVAVIPLFLLFGRTAPAVPFVFAGIIFVNAFFHLIETIKTSKYSPGVVSGSLITIPVVTWLALRYLDLGLLAPWALYLVVGIGVGVHALFFALVRRWQTADATPTNGAALPSHS